MSLRPVAPPKSTHAGPFPLINPNSALLLSWLTLHSSDLILNAISLGEWPPHYLSSFLLKRPCILPSLLYHTCHFVYFNLFFVHKLCAPLGTLFILLSAVPSVPTSAEDHRGHLANLYGNLSNPFLNWGSETESTLPKSHRLAQTWPRVSLFPIQPPSPEPGKNFPNPLPNIFWVPKKVPERERVKQFTE